MEQETRIIYTPNSLNLKQEPEIPFVLQDSKECERWLWEGSEQLKDPKILNYPSHENFTKFLNAILKSPYQDYSGFREWAEKTLPIDTNSPELAQWGAPDWKFPPETLFYAKTRTEIPELKSLTQDSPLEDVYNRLAIFFERKKDRIYNDFKSIRIFGYPVIIIMKKEDWPDAEATATHYSTAGFITIRGFGEIDLEELRFSIIHEITHAGLNYPGNNLYNTFSRDERKLLDTTTYYEPADKFNKEEKEKIKTTYKLKILDIFRQEVECYFYGASVNYGNNISYILKKTDQEWFNYAFAQVENFDRDPREFHQDSKLLDDLREFREPLYKISLTEIKKYDPDFGIELEMTLNFWKLVLEKSSAEKMPEIIKFIQNANTFDQISIKNLESIRKEIDITTFE